MKSAFGPLLAAGCVLLAAAAIAAAQSSADTPHAQVELLSQQAVLSPGRISWLGVHFRLEKGWHIYWQNPGDSGQSPALAWQLPPGFSAGAIQWPVPSRIVDSPEIVDYGYQDEVMLLAPLRAPANLRHGVTHLAVDAKWLICREVCIPEHASLQLDLPVGRAASPNLKNAALFAKFKARRPRAFPRYWRIIAISRPGKFSLEVGSKRMPAIRQAQFFPFHPGEIDNAAPQKLTLGKDMFTLTLKKSDLLQEPLHNLEGVLEVDGKNFIISAPVSHH